MMSEHAAVVVGRLLEGAWTASAVARVIARGLSDCLPEDDPSVPLLLKAGLLDVVDGGYALTGRNALRGFEPIAVANIRASLGQAFAAAGHGTTGWADHSDDILLAQGVVSSAGGRGFAAMIGWLPELKSAFEREQGGVLLDVGVGVAALACAFCEAVPRARVIGLDVLPRALELARQAVSQKQLDDRIELRQVAIQDFDEERVADLAHMPAVFIPPDVLAAGMSSVHRALKPGGWLALSGIVADGPDGAVTRFMAHHVGGTALTHAEAARLAAATGFAEPTVAPLPPGAPRVVLCQAH